MEPPIIKHEPHQNMYFTFILPYDHIKVKFSPPRTCVTQNPSRKGRIHTAPVQDEVGRNKPVFALHIDSIPQYFAYPCSGTCKTAPLQTAILSSFLQSLFHVFHPYHRYNRFSQTTVGRRILRLAVSTGFSTIR